MTGPVVELRDGSRIPQLGVGTSGVDLDAESIGAALDAGFRLIDTAQMYGTEVAIGHALADRPQLASEVYLTTKLDNVFHSRDEILRSFDESLHRLRRDRIDLFLMHWPMPRERDYVAAWRVFEQLLASGRVGSIGVSNFEPHHMRRLLAETDIVPAVNQLELHPYLSRREYRSWLADQGVAVQAWSPLARGAILKDPVVLRITDETGSTPAQVVLRWHLQNGIIAIPKSHRPERLRENLGAHDGRLDDSQLARLDELDRDFHSGPTWSDFE